jgi:Ca-activated chloride channel family protein
VTSERVRRVFPDAVLPWVITFASALAIAQTTIDDVHVAPRDKPVHVASAAYSPSYPGALIHTSSDLVLVPVSITDDRNRPIVGLERANFSIFENKKPQEIKNFSTEDTPVSVGILVDTSRSMSYKLARAREAIVQFCEASNPQDEFFLITFSDEPRIAVDFTNRSEDIASELLTARPKGRTSLLDAVYLGLRKMRDARYARKALLIISDGGDNHSRYSERDVKSAIRESDLTLYSIGTFDRGARTEEELLGPELLRDMADSTGGLAFTLSDEKDMPQVTRNIGTRLRHQYMLAYAPRSSARDGKWRKISIKLRLPKRFPFLHVEARPGYYASGRQ